MNFTWQVLAVVLGVAIAQEPVLQGRNVYREEDGELLSDRRRNITTPIPILQWNKQQEHDGTYKTRYNNVLVCVCVKKSEDTWTSF